VKCKQARPLILELVMGTLREEEKKDLQLHLKGCPNCERERTTLVALTASLKSLPLPDPGEAFWKELPLRVEHEIEKKSEERTWGYGHTPLRIWDWLFQPGKSAYALVSMAIIMIMTVLLFYPRYTVREGDTVRKGGQEVTASLSLPAEESVGDEGEGGTVGFEDLNIQELNHLYSSLVSSVIQKKAEQEVLEEKVGVMVTTDIGAELNDLSADELEVLSRRLFSAYPAIQEKGV